MAKAAAIPAVIPARAEICACVAVVRALVARSNDASAACRSATNEAGRPCAMNAAASGAALPAK